MAEDFVDALAGWSQGGASFTWATWLAAESSDADLSQVQLPNGTIARGVPRFSSATGLSAGKTVMCMSPGPDKPLIIMSIVVGDITSYEA